MTGRDDASPRSQPTTELARDRTPPLGAIVRVTGAPASPPELPLPHGCCILGAGHDATIIVDDDAVSRRHVELELRPEGIAVRDLGSRNGTFYLGQRIERAVLSYGARLTIGSATVAVDLDTSTLDAGEHHRPMYRGLIGQAPTMRRLFAILARLEGSLVNVLVEGESGVGKELVGRAIHAGSAACEGPMVTVNCGAIARELVLSELFGHRKGSFTGATDHRRGAFDAADGGTLFLDEIGELPLDVQPVLLRALETGEVKPVGQDAPHRVAVRVVAATNRDLEAAVDGGLFRADLYYRLAVVKLQVPPLRERRADVPLLARELARQCGAGELPDEVVDELATRAFKGNVRELRNAVQSFLAIGVMPTARVGGGLDGALFEAIDVDGDFAEQRDRVLAAFTKTFLTKLLRDTGGNLTEAARRCGLERSYLGKLARKHGVTSR
jgi:two-component system, NtrC family, response regulator GlrR